MEDATHIDGYELIERIGSGGMGRVYLAEDLRHDRKVAIKMLRPELSEMLGRERFQAEIRVTARLQHPHILPLFDSGEAGGSLYYVMPLVEGESLRQRLEREGRLELSEAIDITRQVGSALQYAHEHGVVHRDIKPENIMLQEGEAIVADFGIALAVADEGRTRFTMAGESVGTPGYMSPEQAAGESDIDERTDVYALGMLLFEMVTGRPAYTGGSARQVIAKVIAGVRPSASELVESLPPEIDAAIERALAQRRADRFASAAELVDALERKDAVAVSGGIPRRAKLVAGAVGLVVLVIVGIVAWQWRERQARRDWARQEAIPEIQRRLVAEDTAGALDLALRARQVLPDDPTLAGLIDVAAATITRVDSEPAGATVSVRDYRTNADWVVLGSTPLRDVLVPDGHVVFRFELEGYRDHAEATASRLTDELEVQLQPADAPDDMVAVPAGTYSMSETPVAVENFWIDRTEVTNARFQRAVDDGLYEDLEAWDRSMAAGLPGFDPDRARLELVDATGRPGPAPWELSRHPEGRGDYPVRGVSWYEAAAYCARSGKRLPTLYHWKLAAGIAVWDSMLDVSNFGDGPVAVDSTGAVGRHGAVDMAGNVREWVWNAAAEGRYILGGAWDAPKYLFLNYESIDPWLRDPTNGLRCARYEDGPAGVQWRAPIPTPHFDFSELEPVDDATFAVYESFYRYDPLPLEATRELVESTDDWVHERVEFDAAYGTERVPAEVFLPTNAEPPYQTVVFFPGITAFFVNSVRQLSYMPVLGALPLSGRALVVPVLEGLFERRYPERPSTPAGRRQLTILQTQDIMRTVDYIVERPDLDEDNLAYMGLSYGAELAVPLALEKRFDAAVLVGAALDPAWRAVSVEEAAPWNFVYRITTPSILINGRQDAMHPWEEGQLPFFNAIDVPAEDKRLVASDAGHLPPANEIIRHTLDWLDERFGRVRTDSRRDAGQDRAGEEQ